MSRRRAPAAVAFGLFILSLVNLGAAELLPAQASTAPGTSAPVPLALRLDATDRVAGLQVDLKFDPKVLGVSVVLGPAARSAAKSAYLGDVRPGQKRLLIAGVSPTPLPEGAVATLFVSVAEDADQGDYTVALTGGLAVSDDGTAIPLAANGLTITVAGPPVLGGYIVPNGILNAASLLPGAISAGEMLTVFGSSIGPAEAEGATSAPDGRILFGDVPAPQIYASPDQISTIVPPGIQGASSVLQFKYRPAAGSPSPAATVGLGPAAIGVFTRDATGAGPAIALNPDGSANSITNAATAGDLVTIFLTGVGKSALSAQVSGLNAPVTGVSALVPGVFAATLRVPAGITSSIASPITVAGDGSTSQEGVTIAVAAGEPGAANSRPRQRR